MTGHSHHHHGSEHGGTDAHSHSHGDAHAKHGPPVDAPAMHDAAYAAAQPAPGDALYFVARGDGSHVFSASLAEHNRAVACHQLRRCR